MTAKEYIYRMLDTRPVEGTSFNMVNASDVQVETAMIAFAEERVKEALQAAADNAEIDIEYGHGDWMLSMTVEKCEVNKDSILNAYPLENIK